jgi:hypothetical protein
LLSGGAKRGEGAAVLLHEDAVAIAQRDVGMPARKRSSYQMVPECPPRRTVTWAISGSTATPPAAASMPDSVRVGRSIG